MKFQLLIFAIVLGCALSASQYPSFPQYVKDYDKVYATSQEYELRKNTYEANIAKFETFTDFTPGVNELTDRTEEQIKALKNLKNLDDNHKTIRVPPTKNKLRAALSIDWRQRGAVTSIKTQGECGACWSFAAAAAAESKLIIEGRFNNSIDLAQQYVLYCSQDGSCGGGYLEFSMKAALQVPLEVTYPYSPFTPQSSLICSAAGVKVGLNSNDYYNLSDIQIINLLQTGPVAISIAATNWEYYSSGVFNCPVGAGVDHAVLLVGYTPNYWIVKNQWGTRWGTSGYIYINRNRATNCGIGTSVHTIVGLPNTSTDAHFQQIMASTPSTNTNTSTQTTTNTTNSTSKNTSLTLWQCHLGVLVSILLLLALTL